MKKLKIYLERLLFRKKEVSQMVDLIVAVPENVLFTLRTDDVEFVGNMKKYTALKLYEAQVVQ